MDENEAVPEKKSNGLKWLISCLVVLLLTGVCCVGGVFFGMPILKGKLIEVVHSEAVEAIKGSGLPEEQIGSILIDLDRLKEAAESDRIDFEKLQGIEEELGRLGAMGAAYWYETGVIPNSELSPEEKADAIRVIQRFARGVQEQSITMSEIERLDIDVENDGSEEGWNADEIRRDVAEVQALVDEKGVPDEAFRADVAAGFTEVVDGLID